MFHADRLVYDEKTKRYHDRKGVEIVVENFGHTAAVENLGTNLQQVAAYRGLIQYFVDRGYTRGKDFKAAPYDWRYAASKNRVVTGTEFPVPPGCRTGRCVLLFSYKFSSVHNTLYCTRKFIIRSSVCDAHSCSFG